MPTFKKNPSPLKYGKKSSAFKMNSPVKFWKNIKQLYNIGKNVGSKLGLTKKPPKGTNIKKYTTDSGTTYKMDSATHSFYSNNPTASKYLNKVSKTGMRGFMGKPRGTSV